jgi:PhnB protein
MELTVHLVARGAARAAAWYAEAFGAEERGRVEVPDGRLMQVELSFGGATVMLADAFWGERYGQLVDPFGHRWGLAQRLRDVPHEEIQTAAAQLFA